MRYKQLVKPLGILGFSIILSGLSLWAIYIQWEVLNWPLAFFIRGLPLLAPIVFLWFCWVAFSVLIRGKSAEEADADLAIGEEERKSFDFKKDWLP